MIHKVTGSVDQCATELNSLAHKSCIFYINMYNQVWSRLRVSVDTCQVARSIFLASKASNFSFSIANYKITVPVGNGFRFHLRFRWPVEQYRFGLFWGFQQHIFILILVLLNLTLSKIGMSNRILCWKTEEFDIGLVMICFSRNDKKAYYKIQDWISLKWNK